MAENGDKSSESAEKAYAAASAAAPLKADNAKAAQPKAAKPAPEPIKSPAAKPAPEQVKPLATKPAPEPVKPVPAVAIKAQPTPKVPKPTITELKDKIMATAKTTDFSKTVTDTVGEFQRRAKEAYDKGAELSAEATEFAKGNVEAMVESSKILAAGVQDLGKTYAEDAKSAYETATADLKELVAVKSPTDLFQLQSKLLRRNLDTFMAFGSKNTEAVVKLVSESTAPISGRVSLATEKLAKVA